MKEYSKSIKGINRYELLYISFIVINTLLFLVKSYNLGLACLLISSIPLYFVSRKKPEWLVFSMLLISINYFGFAPGRTNGILFSKLEIIPMIISICYGVKKRYVIQGDYLKII